MDFGPAFQLAFQLIVSGDPDLLEIIRLSALVSGVSVALACLFGLPAGAMLAIVRFPGRGALVVLINALMGLPPVVVGLVVYMLLSRSGPFGVLGLLYTPTAMVIAQVILILPIIAGLSRQAIAEMHLEYDDHFRAIGLSRLAAVRTLLWDARFVLSTVALAGLGRAIAEVGAVLIVGGNINHVTRVMTTAIALETSRGNLALALALGMILIALAIAINAALGLLGASARRLSHG